MTLHEATRRAKDRSSWRNIVRKTGWAWGHRHRRWSNTYLKSSLCICINIEIHHWECKCFVAFDSVDRPALWKALRSRRVPGFLLKLLGDTESYWRSCVQRQQAVQTSHNHFRCSTEGRIGPGTFQRCTWLDPQPSLTKRGRHCRTTYMYIHRPLYTDDDADFLTRHRPAKLYRTPVLLQEPLSVLGEKGTESRLGHIGEDRHHQRQPS